MKLSVKNLDISTGGIFIALLHKDDALKMDLHVGDRIEVIKSKKSMTCVLDVALSRKIILPGRLGLFNEVVKQLKLKDKDLVEIKIAEKPLSIQYIKKKLEGETLLEKEMNETPKSKTTNSQKAF